MKLKRFFIFSSILFCLAVIIFGLTFLFNKNSPETVKTQAIVEKKELAPSITTKTHLDESGFQFDYPDDLSVVRKEASSSAIYSNLSLVSELSSGEINFLVSDTKNKTINEYISKNISTQSAETAEDVMFGDLSGKKIVLPGQIILAVIDKGVLFRLDGILKNDKNYWEKSLDTIVASFSFVQEAPVSNQNVSLPNEFSSEEDVILEEEYVE